MTNEEFEQELHYYQQAILEAYWVLCNKTPTTFLRSLLTIDSAEYEDLSSTI